MIGSNMVDLITRITRMPKLGETLDAPDFDLGCGGKGANQAIAAAKLGSEVVMLTKVGDDIFGANTIKNFREHGVDTRYIEVVKDITSGVAPIFVDEDARNSILIVKGANNHLLPGDIDAAADDLRGCDVILLQLEIPLETVYYAIEFGEKNEIPVILNPAPGAHLDYTWVSRVSVLVPNETELELITGMPVETMAEITEAARSLLSRGLKKVIVTLGSKGSMLVEQDRIEVIPAVKVDARDTTGAGDAFIGSFAHYYVMTGNITSSMEYASWYAGLSTLNTGTQKSFCTKAVFEDAIRERGWLAAGE